MSDFDKKLLLLYEELPEDVTFACGGYVTKSYIAIDASCGITITLPSPREGLVFSIQNNSQNPVIIQMPHEVMYDE